MVKSHQCRQLQACVSMRKQGKKLAVYDLKLEIAWVGAMAKPDSKPVEGVVKISEFATESDEDDWVLECSTVDTGADAVRCHRHT
jgi:Activator of Hsp90 ATPase, N-terminal